MGSTFYDELQFMSLIPEYYELKVPLRVTYHVRLKDWEYIGYKDNTPTILIRGREVHVV